MPLLSTLLELFPCGVVIVKPTGGVFRLNSLAADILHRNPEVAIQAGAFVATVPIQAGKIRAAIESASVNETTRPAAFRITREQRRPLFVVVVPHGVPTSSQVFSKRRQLALVLLSDPELNFLGDAQLISAIFNLTPAESAIAARVLAGEDGPEIAANLGVSLNTVRNHLKRLFQKTNTRGHSELLYTLLRSPGALHFRAHENNNSYPREA